MKKLLMLFAIVAFTGSVAVAQSCPYSKKEAKSVSNDLKEKKVCTATAAAKLASADENISSKTCSTSGKTSYFRKSVCAKSGKVSMTEVVYSAKAKGFVNVSPSEMNAEAKKASLGTKKACTKGAKATCTKGAKASKVSLSTKKACTKGAKATCTKGAKASKVSLNATAKKSCCSSGKACAKACCAAKGKAAVKEVKATAKKVKLVKSEK